MYSKYAADAVIPTVVWRLGEASWVEAPPKPPKKPGLKRPGAHKKRH